MVTELPEIKVMYVVSEDGAAGARNAFDKLESNLPTLKGRKFYGVIFGIPPEDKYWASVELNESDKPDGISYIVGIIPGGKYARERINNWNENLNLIGEAFKQLSQKYEVDPSRPAIEFYRSMKDMLVRLPIK